MNENKKVNKKKVKKKSKNRNRNLEFRTKIIKKRIPF